MRCQKILLACSISKVRFLFYISYQEFMNSTDAIYFEFRFEGNSHWVLVSVLGVSHILVYKLVLYLRVCLVSCTMG